MKLLHLATALCLSLGAVACSSNTSNTSTPNQPVSYSSSPSEPWEQFVARETCKNIRNGTPPRQAGERAAITALQNGYANDVINLTQADINRTLLPVLLSTCPNDLANAS